MASTVPILSPSTSSRVWPTQVATCCVSYVVMCLFSSTRGPCRRREPAREREGPDMRIRFLLPRRRRPEGLHKRVTPPRRHRFPPVLVNVALPPLVVLRRNENARPAVSS